MVVELNLASPDSLLSDHGSLGLFHWWCMKCEHWNTGVGHLTFLRLRCWVSSWLTLYLFITFLHSLHISLPFVPIALISTWSCNFVFPPSTDISWMSAFQSSSSCNILLLNSIWVGPQCWHSLVQLQMKTLNLPFLPLQRDRGATRCGCHWLFLG